MRIDQSGTIKIVERLVASGDKNAYWIAYRACRNLVKKEPMRLMDLLKADRYIYKDRKSYRKNSHSNDTKNNGEIDTSKT